MKILFYILAAYLIYMMLRRRFGRGPGAGRGQEPGARGGMSNEPSTHGRAPTHEESVGEEMVQDPVCESYVPVSEALKVRTRLGVVYFCGPECREKFLANSGD